MDPNQDQGVVEPVVNETQPAESVPQEPTPSSEQTQPAGESQEQVATEPQDTQPDNPRTAERMQELLAENKRLKTQQNEKNYGTSVFDSLNPQTQAVPQAQPTQGLSQAQVESIQSQFVAPDGTVDINGFNQAISQAAQRAQAAETSAKQANDRIMRLEESQQQKEANAVHPWLNAGDLDNFDPKGFELVRNQMLADMVLGKRRTVLEVANEISEIYKPKNPVDVAKVEQKAVENFKKTQEARAQGPIEAGAGQPRQSSDQDLQDLRARTRKGDLDAIAERLKGVEVIKS